MSDMLKVILSLSFSGSLLIIAIFLCRLLVRDVMSRQWQYYLWLIVIARLLLPFAPQESLSGTLFLQAEQQGQTGQIRNDMSHIDFVFFGNYGSVPDQSVSSGTNRLSGQNEISDTSAISGQSAASDIRTMDEQNTMPDENIKEHVDTGVGSSGAGMNVSDASMDSSGTSVDSSGTGMDLLDAESDQHTVISKIAMTDLVDDMVPILWLVWFGVAVSLLIRKVTAYQSFVNYVKAGWKEVSDIRLLDRLAQIGEQMGIKRPVELYENHLVPTPMLIGFFKPYIVLPAADVPELDFLYTIRHELTHYKRRDAFYKWLAQAAICIHWFNPLVWLMGRELSRACELACDEAVIQKLDVQERRIYGDTLLHAIGAGCKKSITSIMLCESAQLLKERLKAIMNFKKKSKLVTMLSAMLTSLLMTGAVTAGAYTGAVSQDMSPDHSMEQKDTASDLDNQEVSPESGSGQEMALKQSLEKKDGSYDFVRQCYEAGSIPLFKAAFPQLDKKDQKLWLDQCYADDNIVFFGAAIDTMDAESSLIASLAERAYADGEIAFFSILANNMTNQELESWLSRALKDGDFAFQSMIYNAIGDDESAKKLEELNKKWEKQMLEKYKEYGITKTGKAYYYKGSLVGILYDVQSGGSHVYNLDINPKGTVHVKITRGSDGEIERVGYMSSKEEKELLQEIEDLEENEKGEKSEEGKKGEEDDSRSITIPVNITRVKNGKFIWLGTYRLEKGDRVYYDISAESGKRLIVGFARPEDKNPKTTYHTISNVRSDGTLEVKSGGFKWKDPAGIEKYSLFIHTTGGTLKNVKGEVKIVRSGNS